jgi:predicted kinase
MKTRKILILRGLQGSGKSTFAKAWAAEEPEQRVRFNRDDIRNMLGTYWIPAREPLIDHIYEDFLNEAMLKEYDIVVDNMNLSQKYIDQVKEIIDEFNEWARGGNLQYELEIKDFFNVPLETCIERDAQREHPIGEAVIRNTYAKYKNSIEPWKYL